MELKKSMILPSLPAILIFSLPFFLIKNAVLQVWNKSSIKTAPFPYNLSSDNLSAILSKYSLIVSSNTYYLSRFYQFFKPLSDFYSSICPISHTYHSFLHFLVFVKIPLVFRGVVLYLLHKSTSCINLYISKLL